MCTSVCVSTMYVCVYVCVCVLCMCVHMYCALNLSRWWSASFDHSRHFLHEMKCFASDSIQPAFHEFNITIAAAVVHSFSLFISLPPSLPPLPPSTSLPSLPPSLPLSLSPPYLPLILHVPYLTSYKVQCKNSALSSCTPLEGFSVCPTIAWCRCGFVYVYACVRQHQ
jgi:hypothetical protein